MDKQALPLPEWAMPWGWGGLLVLGGVVLGGGALVFLADSPAEGDLMQVAFVLTAFGLAMLCVSGLQARRLIQWRRVAKQVGLRFRARVYPDDLDPRFLLFGLTMTGRHWAGYHLSGDFEGEALAAFTYGFIGQYETSAEPPLSRAGQQTVFLVADGGGLPEFHLSPEDDDWYEALDARHWLFTSPALSLTLGFVDGSRALIRGPDERRLRAVFHRASREEMEVLTGWTVECRCGQLLLYRDRETAPMDKMERALERVVHLVRMLRAAVSAQ